AFLDQRENRAAARGYARGRGLDCFSFHGSFALHLAKGCDQVVAIDVSQPAIERARRNAELNGASNVQFIEANVFDQLRDYDSAGERFDTIVLDPPAFAKNRGAVEAALRGYKEINLRALRLLNPGGVLITCSCSYHVGEELFLGVLAEAARDAGRDVQIIEKRTQARDHPILLTVPETYYLKCVALRVMG
ncbi:MAG: class I SAM-dependent rRNA methyltransferase, partial [Blastocatellia bacterium]